MKLIDLDKLARILQPIKDYITNILTQYQMKTDNTLTTTDKTIVGAINELETSTSNNTTSIENLSNKTTTFLNLDDYEFNIDGTVCNGFNKNTVALVDFVKLLATTVDLKMNQVYRGGLKCSDLQAIFEGNYITNAEIEITVSKLYNQNGFDCVYNVMISSTTVAPYRIYTVFRHQFDTDMTYNQCGHTPYLNMDKSDLLKSPLEEGTSGQILAYTFDGKTEWIDKSTLVDLSGYAKTTDLHNHNNKTALDGITESKITQWDNKSNFSGSYNDLTDIPNNPIKYYNSTEENPITWKQIIEENNLGYDWQSYIRHVDIILNGTISSTTFFQPTLVSIDFTENEKFELTYGNFIDTFIKTETGDYFHSLSDYHYAEKDHNHDDVYASISHEHSQYLTEHQDLSEYAKIADLHNHDNKTVLDSITIDKTTEWDSKAEGSHTHSYTSLTDLPIIPSKTSDLTNDSSFITLGEVPITTESYNKTMVLPPPSEE